jgi:hypothetical protein
MGINRLFAKTCKNNPDSIFSASILLDGFVSTFLEFDLTNINIVFIFVCSF